MMTQMIKNKTFILENNIFLRKAKFSANHNTFIFHRDFILSKTKK